MKKQQRPGKLFSQIEMQNVRRARYDIAQWRKALNTATNVENPNRAQLYNIYMDAGLDALLSSQIENRKMQTLGTPYQVLNQAGETDEQTTQTLIKSAWFPRFLSQLLDTPYWGHSLWEITLQADKTPSILLIPRKHVRPQTGEILLKESDAKGIAYRQMREYGRYIIETGDNEDVGKLNRAIPHVLTKRFAQSCWSEFCEIFGMPLRTLKTNTSDPEMLRHAEEIMRSLGAVTTAIIDNDEKIEYAEAAKGDGQVYGTLIGLCNQEISLLVAGAILGQDTQHGTRGKEQVSFDILADLVRSDTVFVENFINSTLFPALAASGVIPQNLSFHFRESEDLDALWNKTREALMYYDIPPEWIEDKFGIPVTKKELSEGSFQLSEGRVIAGLTRNLQNTADDSFFG